MKLGRSKDKKETVKCYKENTERNKFQEGLHFLNDQKQSFLLNVTCVKRLAIKKNVVLIVK